MPQSLSKVLVHIIFSTKNRHNFISKEIKDELYRYISGTLKNIRSEPIIINGVSDHIHILCTLPRIISQAGLLEEIKKSSSKWIKTKDKSFEKFAWQSGYGIFSVSSSLIKNVVTYIKNQEEHHKKVTFQEEFILFLKKYNIEYDERYLWE
jgi:putative transposase